MRLFLCFVAIGPLSVQARSASRILRHNKRSDVVSTEFGGLLNTETFDGAYLSASWATPTIPPYTSAIPTDLGSGTTLEFDPSDAIAPAWDTWDGRAGIGQDHDTYYFHRGVEDFCVKMDTSNTPAEDLYSTCLLTITPWNGNATDAFSVAVYDSQCQNLTVPDLYYPLETGRLYSSPHLSYPLNLTSWEHLWGWGSGASGQEFLRIYPDQQQIMGPWMSFEYAGVKYNLGDSNQCTCNYMKPPKGSDHATFSKRQDLLDNKQLTIWTAAVLSESTTTSINPYGDVITSASVATKTPTVTNLQGPSLVPLCQCEMPCHWPRPGNPNADVWAPAYASDWDYGKYASTTTTKGKPIWWTPPPTPTSARKTDAFSAAPTIPTDDKELSAFAGDDFGTHYFDWYNKQTCVPLDKLQAPYAMMPGNLAATCFANFRYDQSLNQGAWRVTLYDSQCQNITRIGTPVDGSGSNPLRGRWMAYPIWPSASGGEEDASIHFDMQTRSGGLRYMVQPAATSGAQTCYTQYVSQASGQQTATVLSASAAGATAVYQCRFACHWKRPIGSGVFEPGQYTVPAATPGTAVDPATWTGGTASDINEPSWTSPLSVITAAPTNPNEPGFSTV